MKQKITIEKYKYDTLVTKSIYFDMLVEYLINNNIKLTSNKDALHDSKIE